MSTNRGFILMFAGQKGGAGKSTAAINVAVELTKQGADLLLLDCDIGQLTSSKWVSRRNESILEGLNLNKVHSSIQSDNIKSAALDAAQRYDVVIIDCAGRDGRAMRSGLIVADAVYIPTRPSQHDLETFEHVSTIIEETNDLNPGRVVRTFLSMSPTNPSIKEERDAREFLSDFNQSMPLSDCVLRDRKAYRDASLDGMGVVEGKNMKAKAEVQMLTKEILSHV